MSPARQIAFVSRGTNQLLREGAKLVENADDIIEELEPILKSKIKELKAIQPEPAAEKTNFNSAAVIRRRGFSL